MTRVSVIIPLIAALLGAGCASGGRELEPDPPPPPAEAASIVGGDGILPRPFTAEQIRDEWIVGFQVTMSRVASGEETTERWTVIAASDEWVEIESTILDARGHPAGEPTVERSTWLELRNHATFPAAGGTRQEVTRETSLGSLDGWLYTVRDEAAGTVTEFFFARDLPGAPVHMRVLRGDDTVMELAQVERHRPR